MIRVLIVLGLAVALGIQLWSMRIADETREIREQTRQAWTRSLAAMNRIHEELENVAGLREEDESTIDFADDAFIIGNNPETGTAIEITTMNEEERKRFGVSNE